MSWLPAAVGEALEAELPAVGEQERFIVTGAGRDLPTAHEAVLKLREGAWVAAEVYETGAAAPRLPRRRRRARCARSSSEGEGRAAERAAPAAAALQALGCDATLVPTRHPVVDVVLFQRLAVHIADARGREPDRIHRHDPRWAVRGGGRQGGGLVRDRGRDKR